MRYLRLPNWEHFQHYKDRDPPWVKLYRDLLTSESWVLGTDLSRVVQIASVMLAPRYNNLIPLRFDLLKRIMSLECKEADFNKSIGHLCETKFLEIHEVPSDSDSVEQSASAVLATCASETEQRRADKSRSETEIHVAQERDVGLVETVFDHWRQEHGHPKAQLDAKRRVAITAALRVYSAEDLCTAVTGYRNSPHHMGQNARNTVYSSIELFLRDAAHIDAGIAFARGPPLAETDTTAHNNRALNQWVNSDGQGEIRDSDGEIGRGVQPKSLAAPAGTLLGGPERKGH